MEIRDYEPEMAGKLAEFYSEIVKGVPYCFPITADEWIQGVGLDLEMYSSQALMVAMDEDDIRGFVNPAVLAAPSEGGTIAHIRGLFFRETDRLAGDALVETAEAFLRNRKVGRVSCFPIEGPYRFYHFGYGYLTERLWHIYALLGLKGYQSVVGEVYLDWKDFEPPRPPAELAVDGLSFEKELKPGRGTRPGLFVNCVRDGEVIGRCKAVSVMEYTDEAAMEDWAFIKRVDVYDPKYRGKRLGRAVLIRALGELRQLGYRHVSISTALTNYRALLFYASTGFKSVATTFYMEKKLD